MKPEHVFIVYGSLAPGRPNYSKIANIGGHWKQGIIQGRLEHHGWGAELGYPGYVKTKNPEPIAVQLLFSEALPDYWQQLDDFEGDDYQRIVIDFTSEDGEKGKGNVYALKGSHREPSCRGSQYE